MRTLGGLLHLVACGPGTKTWTAPSLHDVEVVASGNGKVIEMPLVHSFTLVLYSERHVIVVNFTCGVGKHVVQSPEAHIRAGEERWA